MDFPLRRIVLVAALLSACSGGNQDPDGAAAPWGRIHTTDYPTAFTRAPGYPGKTASTAPHGDQVEIWVNPTLQAALDAKKPLTAWPDGSMIVKDGYKSGTFRLVAVMEKRGASWYWAEYESDGTVDYSGAPATCTDCHASGADYVRAFALPK